MQSDNRNQDDFIKMVDQSGSIINKITYYYSNSREEAEDLRQDVVAALWEAWRSFRGDAKVSTWVYRITLNVCVTSVRKASKRPSTMDIARLQPIAQERDVKSELLARMHSMILQLPQADKAIILLWLDELSYDEIADVTGLNRNTIATKLRRAKQKLLQLSK